jgi:hypothetical protein
MPTLSMFLGILIKMNWGDTGQHNVAHFHAFYGEYEASFTLSGELLAGTFPGRQAAFVRAWALMHEEELKANWELAKSGEETFRIDPLR